MTDDELDQVTEIMISRYRAMSASEILSAIRPLDILFAWNQAGDAGGPRSLIEAHIDMDEDLVDALERLTTPVSSSEGDYSTLRRENLEPFLDYDRARNRVDALKNGGEFAERAEKLAIAFEAARDR